MWVLDRGYLCLVSAFCGVACASSPVAPEPGVAASAERLAGAPAVGPEIGTVAPVLEPSDLGNNPELASDGVGFLSVQEVSGRIRAVRVDDGGHVLDADWLDFGTGDGTLELYPAAAFGAGHYLVTWSKLETDAEGNDHFSVEGRFVAADGTLEGSGSVTLSSGNAVYSSVAWDGEHFVLAYLASGDGGVNDIHSVLLDPDGTRVEASDHALTTSGSCSNPHAGAGATATLVVWEEYTRSDEGFDTSPRIHGARIGRNGDVLDDAPFALSTAPGDPPGALDETMPDVASGAGDFLVVWQASDMTVHGSLLAENGAFGSTNFRIDHGTGGAELPSAAFQGEDFAVGWTDARDGGSLYGTRVSLAGSPGSGDVALAADAPREVGFGSDHTNLAFDGAHLFFTYIGSDPNGVEGSLLSPELALAQGGVALTAIPDSQGFPYTTFDGTNYVVAWNDEASSLDTPVRAVRISGAGQVLDTAGIAVSPPDAPAFSFSIASPRDGSSLFIWSGTDDVPHQRSLAADATLGAVGPFVTQNGAGAPALASDGRGYLSAFDAGGSSDTGSVHGHLLGLDGSSGAEFRIDASTLNTGPFVLATGTGYLVVYARSGMHLVTVSDTGALGDVLDLTSTVAGVNGASSDTSSLLAWSDNYATAGPLQARFVKAGAFSGNTFELTPDSLGYAPALAWDGTRYWAVWESSTHELDGRSIGEDGSLGSVSSLVPAEVYAPALASDGKGQLLLSYAKLAGERRSYRIASRLIGRGADATGGTGGTGGSAGTGGSSSPATGGTNSGSGGTGSPETGGTSATGAGGSSTAGSGGTSTSGAGGSGGTVTATGGTSTSGSGGSPAAGGSAGAAAGSSASGGSGGSSPGGCSLAHGSGGRTPVLGALFGLAWAFAARRRRARSLP